MRSLVGLSMRRRGGYRSLTGVVSVLVVAALAMLAFPALTDIFGAHRQVVIESKFSQPAFKTVYRDHRVAVGDGITRLVIDNSRVSVNVLVVEGTTVAALRAGAGHYEHTPYPCGQGNVGIAGHRTTYGRPFSRLDYMRPGDTVTLTTPIGQCVYQVVPGADVIGEPTGAGTLNDGAHNPFFVYPNEQSVVSAAGELGTGYWLTLTSCNPPGLATQRIVLRLKMISCKGPSCPKEVPA
ncbi:MAG: class E sortase [Frankiaceae bacterium]|nr:class E sortase [Frankiaceae bacterium]